MTDTADNTATPPNGGPLNPLRDNVIDGPPRLMDGEAAPAKPPLVSLRPDWGGDAAIYGLDTPW